MLLIVTGTRTIKIPVAERIIQDFIESSLPTDEAIFIIHGDSGGVDLAAKKVGDSGGRFTQQGFPVTSAEWEKYGKPAGLIRNAWMVGWAIGWREMWGDEIEGLAVWDGTSAGTKHCISLMVKHNLVHTILNENGGAHGARNLPLE